MQETLSLILIAAAITNGVFGFFVGTILFISVVARIQRFWVAMIVFPIVSTLWTEYIVLIGRGICWMVEHHPVIKW